MPSDIRDWLAPDQWRGIEAFYIEGRLRTDRDLFERLDRQMIYQPDAFAGVDLDRHRLLLDDEDRAHFAAAQKVIADGTQDPAFIRYRRARLDADRTLEAKGIDTDDSVAATVRKDIRDGLHSFEAIEGQPPNGEDIAAIVAQVIDRSVGEDSPAAAPADGAFDPGNIILAQAGGGGSRGGGGGSGRPPQLPPAATPQRPPAPGPGHNQPPREIPDGLPTAIERWRRWTQHPVPPPVAPTPPDIAGPRAAAEQIAAQDRAATYDIYREHLQKLDPDNALLKLETVPGVPPDRNTVDSYEREVKNIVREKVDKKVEDLRARSTYEDTSRIRTIGGDVDLRADFERLKSSGTRIYMAKGQYSKDGNGELYLLPGGEGLRVGFRMANDMRTKEKNSVPTLDVIYPDNSSVRFHYNNER